MASDPTFEGSYSDIADEQLDDLENGPDHDLHNAALDACELIFVAPDQAQFRSTAVTTREGIRFRLPIAGHPPYKVFWSSADAGPRIEAVSRTPTKPAPPVREWLECRG